MHFENKYKTIVQLIHHSCLLKLANILFGFLLNSNFLTTYLAIFVEGKDNRNTYPKLVKANSNLLKINGTTGIVERISENNYQSFNFLSFTQKTVNRNARSFNNDLGILTVNKGIRVTNYNIKNSKTIILTTLLIF